MKKTLTIIIFLVFLSSVYSQITTSIYPSTLEELFAHLEESYHFQEEDLAADTFDNFIYWKYRSTIGSYINDCLFKYDTDLISNINPKNWRIHKESYVPFIMEAYWSNLKGLDYNLDLKFECDDRYSKSCDVPIVLPKDNLVRDSSYISIRYLYKGYSCTEIVYYYRTGTDNLLYLYSYHFGWYVIKETEDEQMMKSENYEEEIWNLLQTHEKLTF